MMAGNHEPRMNQELHELGVKTESENLNCDSASSVRLNSDLHQNGACLDSAMSVDYVMEVSLASDNEVKTEIEYEPNHSPKPTFSQSESELALQCGRISDLKSGIGACSNIKDEIKTEPKSTPGSSVPDPGHALTECDNVNRSEFEATRHSSRESEVISVALEKDIIKQELSDETNSPTNILNQETQLPWCDDEFEGPKLKHEKSVSNSVEGNLSGALLKIEVEDPLQRSGYQLVDTGNQEQVSCPDVYGGNLGFTQQIPTPVMNENPSSMGHPHGFPRPLIIAETVSSATAGGTANSKSITIMQLVRVKRDENNQGPLPSPGTSLLGTSGTAGHQDTGIGTFNQENVTENFMNQLSIKSSYSFSCSSDLELQYPKDTQSNHSDRHDKPYRCEIRVCNGRRFATHTEYLQHKRSHAPTIYGMYRCKNCQMLFQSQFSFVHHECSYEFETPFSCEHCGKKFEAQAFLLCHQRYSHNVKGKCKFCGDEFDGKVLDDHERNHTEQNPYKCSYCPLQFHNSTQRLRHEKCHATHKCQFCNLSFRNKSTCRLHERRYHVKTENLKCKYCNYRASGSESLIAHESTCTYPQERCICRHCGETFATYPKKREHENKVHTSSNTQSANSYECQHCKKGFFLQRHCLKHEKTCGSPVAVTEEGASLQEQNKDEDSPCHILTSKFDLGGEEFDCKILDTHDEPVHTDQEQNHDENSLSHIVTSSNLRGKEFDGKSKHEQTNTQQNSYKCRYCPHILYNSTRRRKHEQRYHAIHKCRFCDLSFRKAGTLTHHEIRKHGTRKGLKLRCKYCNYTASDSESRIAHESTCTFSQKQYKCGHCDERFATIGERLEHQHEVHAIENPLPRGIRSYECQHCKKVFSLQSLCLNHEKLCANPVTEDVGASLQKQTQVDNSLCHIDIETSECNFCGEKFDSKIIEEHERTHIEHNPKKCSICDHRRFSTRSRRDRHERLFHGLHICRFCRQSFRTKEQCTRHQKEHLQHLKKLKCKYCKHTASDSESLVAHESTCTYSQKQYTCSHCGAAFAKEKSKLQHERWAHTQNDEKKYMYECQHCKKGFNLERHYLKHEKSCGNSVTKDEQASSPLHVQRHSVTKDEQAPSPLHVQRPSQDEKEKNGTHGIFKCRSCKKSFKEMTSLGEHIATCTLAINSKVIHCNYCDRVFKMKESHRKHELLHVNHNGVELHKCKYCNKMFTSFSIRRHELEHKCKICGKSFRKKGYMYSKGHILTHTVEKPLTCKQCGKHFKSERGLQEHELIHSGVKPHKCRFCDQTFRLNTTRLYHEQVHTGERHKCQLCEKSFKYKVCLLQHQLVHTGEKPHKCKYCDKAFADKSSRGRHELLHTGIKPHQCRFCDQTFRLKVSLRRHELVHTGERFYKCKLSDKSEKAHHHCKYCDRVYANKNNHRQHERLHELSHSAPGGKPLQCKYCDKTFASSSGLRKHEIFHTGAGTYHCEQCEKTFINNSTLQRHMLVHSSEKTHLCIHCGVAFKHKYLLSKHELQHSSSPGSHVEEGPTEKPVDEILHSGEKIQHE